MSQQTYTFACPVCAVRLSVPKALAGVRGPCPQCHHEITAPEPEAALEPALASAGTSGTRTAPAPLAVDPPLPSRPAAPRVAGAPPPLPPPPASVPRPAEPLASPPRPPVPALTEAVAAIPVGRPPALPSGAEVEPGAPAHPSVTSTPLPAGLPLEPVAAEPIATAVAPQGLAHEANPEDEEPAVHQAQPARRSRVGVALAVLLVLGLLAAAVLNLLPRQSLRHWIGKVLPAQTVDAVMGPDPDASAADTAATNPPVAVVPSPAPAPMTTGIPENSTPTAPSPVEIRPALTAPEVGPAAVAAAPEAPVAPPEAAPEAVASVPVAPAPEAEPAAVDPSADPSSASPESVAPPMVSDGTPPSAPPIVAVPSTPGAASAAEAGVASLLPDISGGTAPAAAAVDEARAGAQEALTLFLQARKWTDRVALSHGGEGLQAEMAAYYKKVKDGPNPPTSVDYIASGPPGADGKSMVEVFHVTFADLPQGFPVSVRQSEEGWKVDWQAFVEFREGRLKKFLAQYQEAPSVFRVRLQRARYQDSAVPNLDQKYVFRVAAPIDGHEGYVFVDKEDSIIAPKVAEMLGWEETHLVMAKLKWVRATSGRPYVELRDIVSQSWRETP